MAYKSVIFEEDAPGGKDISLGIRRGLNMTPAGDPVDNFDRYYSVYPEREFQNCVTYVFFVRPQLNLLKNKRELDEQAMADPIIRYVWEMTPEAIHYVSRNSKYDHQFIPYFTSRVESFQVPDFTLKTASITQPYTGYNIPYGQIGIESTTGSTFDVTFRDDSDLRILNTHRVWTEYIHNVTFGLFTPYFNPSNPSAGPIAANVMDYGGSAYEIVCRPDGRSIVWWDKYTGIFPFNVPDSNFSFNKGSTYDSKLSFSYAFFHHKPMDPVIFRDFNYNSGNYGNMLETYDPEYVSAGNGIVGNPFIYRSAKTGEFCLGFSHL